MKLKYTYLALFIALIVTACGGGGGGDDTPDPCTVAINISVSGQTDASAGQADGSVTVSATGGNGGFEYRVAGGAFQSSGTFTDLAAGTVTIEARDSEGCTATIQVTIQEGAAVTPSFASEVQPLMIMRCATTGCHVSGGSAPFVISDFASVSGRTGSIRARVAGRTMPPASATQLTDAEIAIIVNWVDGGAPNN